jgi:flagellar motor switch protein FliG
LIARLVEVLGERVAELLVPHILQQLRQRLERERALDPQQLAELLEDEVAWVR